MMTTTTTTAATAAAAAAATAAAPTNFSFQTYRLLSYPQPSLSLF